MEGYSTELTTLKHVVRNVIEITGLHWHSQSLTLATCTTPPRSSLEIENIFLVNALQYCYSPFSLFIKTMHIIRPRNFYTG